MKKLFSILFVLTILTSSQVLGQMNGTMEAKKKSDMTLNKIDNENVAYGADSVAFRKFATGNPKINIIPYELQISDSLLTVNPGSWFEYHLNPPKITLKYLNVKNTTDSTVNFNVTVNSGNLCECKTNEPFAGSDISINGLLYDESAEFISEIDSSKKGSPQSDNSVIRYDDGVNYGIFGFSFGGVNEIAAYFPAEYLSQFAGMFLSGIEIYTGDAPQLSKIKIYGEGTPSEPGLLLYDEMVFPIDSAWNIFVLADEIEITDSDIWIGFEATHNAGKKPFGFDSGPAIADFGDFIYWLDGWLEFSNFGYDNNWNLAGHLTEGSYGASNDVGVAAILSPESGFNLSEEMVTIRLKNYGTEIQTQIPVVFMLDSVLVFSGNIEESLASGETLEFTFPETIDLSSVGQTYRIDVCTGLTGDEFTGNDCKTASIKNAPLVYCFASSHHNNEYIKNVLFGSINNLSDWQINVADYTSIFNPLVAGTSEPITVFNGNPWPEDRVFAWIDWNNDVSFDIINEDYLLTDTSGTGQIFTGEISIPAGVEPGEYRMRIRMVYTYTNNPCDAAYWGEVEDYAIHVIEQPAIDVGVQYILAPVSGVNLGDEFLTVRVKNYGLNALTNIPVSYSVDGGPLITEFVAGPLNSGEVADYTFNEMINLGNPGQSYFINAFTVFVGDEIESNDSKATTITHTFPAYCMPFTKIDPDYIYKVTCGSINNTSEWQYGVADYTSISTIIEEGASQNIHVSAYYYQQGKVTVWVDWNKDFTFNSNNEIFVLTGSFNGVITVPQGTPAGEYRMRVRLNRTNPPTPCENSYYGETEDYTIIVVPQPTNDVGIQTILSPYSFFYLGDEIVKIRIKNFGSATQSNIPVFYTIDGGPQFFGTVEGPIQSRQTYDYTFPGTVNLGTLGQTYLINICTTLDGDEVAVNDCKTISVKNQYPGYCDCCTSVQDEYIANVQFGEINNSSGWQNCVADYTMLSNALDINTSENIIVTNGNAWTSDYVYVWVDWNVDYEFDWGATTERYILENVGGTGEMFTGDISVPAGTPNGSYRMRIRMTYSTPPCPCGDATYGETEDYTIIVTGSQAPCWISASPLSATLEPDETMEILLFFNSYGRLAGFYNGSVDFNITDPFISNINVPVTLHIGQCPLPPPLNIVGHEILPNIAYLSWQVPEPSGNLLGYNIYRNNQKINPDIVSNLFYEDSLTNPSQYFYHVTAVYPECEASSDTISLVITNLNEKENSGITIFPNPATNFVNIKSQHSINQISILNNLGQMVFEGDFESNSVQVNTSGFNKGIYIIQVKTLEGIVVRKLVIK